MKFLKYLKILLFILCLISVFPSCSGDTMGNERVSPASGSLDISFIPGTEIYDNVAVNSIVIQNDDKILVGRNTLFDSDTAIVRLNPNGSIDPSFNLVGAVEDGGVIAIAIQNDEKIIIGCEYAMSSNSSIIRLNTNGNIDTSFDSGTGPDGLVCSIAVQNDDKILIGGGFTSYDGTSIKCIARLNADGSLDTSFDPGTGPNGYIKSIVIENNGKIFIGGEFSSYNGTARNDIARLNTDGSLDTSFDPGTGFDNVVFSASLQTNGNIIIGGRFTSYNGTARNRIARLNIDGTLDSSFDPGEGLDNDVNSIAIKNDGKILIGGNFSSYDGTNINNFARLNTDGTLDISFNTGTGPNSYIKSIAIQSSGKILIGGGFTSYSETTIMNIARVWD